MRINLYSQELILDNPNEALEIVTQIAEETVDGLPVIYSGIRMYFKSPDELHHEPGDDDRSAITFWLPKSTNNRQALQDLFTQMANMVDDTTAETGLD
jgi:hypothetical protein